MQRAALLIAAVTLAGGCRHSLGGFAMVAPPTSAPRAHGGPQVEGKDCATWLFGLPLGAPSLTAATRAALAHHAGAGRLLDVQVQSSFWSAMAFGQECLIVRGTPAA